MNKSRPTLWQRLKQLFLTSSALSRTDADTQIATHAIVNDTQPPRLMAAASQALNDMLPTHSMTAASVTPTPTTPATITAAAAQGLSKAEEGLHAKVATEMAQMVSEPVDDVAMSEPDWLIDTPISVGAIESMLEQLGYQFVYHPVQPQDEQHIHHFTMQVSDKAHEWGCMVRYLAEQQLMAVYSILPFPVPESHRADMLAVISYLNYDLVIGNLEMDVQDGELRFKTSLDLEVTGVNELVLSYLLQSNFSLVSRLYETLEEVVKKPKPTGDMHHAIDALVNVQQAHTYYLMSDAIQ